jgi:tryptophan 2,3-dioxygenase
LEHLKQTLESNKKRFKENSEMIAAQTLFKKIKEKFEELKLMLAEFHEKKLQRNQNLQQSKDFEEKQFTGLQKLIKLKQTHLLQVIKEWADHQENLKELIEEKTELQKRIRELELLIDLKQSQLQVSSLLKESEMQENRKI